MENSVLLSKKRNNIMSVILLIMAFSNAVMLYFLDKPFKLLIVICLSAMLFGLSTYLFSKLNLDKFASYWYTFGIFLIIQLYSIIDRAPETLLFLFVCIAMCAFYLSWKLVLFGTSLAITEVIIDYVSYPFLFQTDSPFASLCYYMFSFIAVGGMTAYLCYSIERLMAKAYKSEQMTKQNNRVLQQHVQEQQTTFEQISAFSAVLNENVSKTAVSYHENALTFDEIHQSFTSQADSLSELTENINHIKKTSEIIAESTDKLHVSNRECGIEIKKSTEEVRSLEDTVLHLQTAFENNVSSSHRLVDKTEDVKKIIEIILSISKNTDLLALNASIEASRLGGAGSGFKVIAEEIKKLSQTTKNYVNEVSSTIKEIQEETKQNLDFTMEANNYIGKTLENGKQVKQVFQMIVKNSESIKNETAHIASLIKEQDDSLKHTNSATLNLNALSEENTSSLQNIQQNFNEIKKQMNTIEFEFNKLEKVVNQEETNERS